MAPEGLPPLAEAVSLALGVLREAGVAHWADLPPVMPAHLRIDDRQYALLEQWSGYFALIRFGPAVPKTEPGDYRRTITLAVCPVCGEHETVVTSASRRCRMRLWCEGAPVKAPPAKAAPEAALAPA